MGIPARPERALHEGPAGSCVLWGHDLAWTNCTPTSFAMGVNTATLGRRDPTGCSLRLETDDRSGGTTIPTCSGAVLAEYGIKTENRVGSNVCTPLYLATKLRAGCPVVIQGNAGVLLGTIFRSTKGYVNHAIFVSEGRGWHDDGHGHLIPTDVLVWDPAADGRHAGWGQADTSPAWWPWSLLLRFIAALRPWGDTDLRTLGPGKVYAAFFPDVNPHVHMRFTAAVRTTPFPRNMYAVAAVGHRVNERSGPGTTYGIVATLARGARFVAYQQHPAGQLLAGSRLWYGDHDGKRWVHSSGLR